MFEILSVLKSGNHFEIFKFTASKISRHLKIFFLFFLKTVLGTLIKMQNSVTGKAKNSKFVTVIFYIMLGPQLNLTFTTLWANSANHKLMIFFLFFQENRR